MERLTIDVCVECGSEVQNGEHLRDDLPPCGVQSDGYVDEMSDEERSWLDATGSSNA